MKKGMTNDEFPMTKEILMTNDEGIKVTSRVVSSFVLRHSLVIRHSSFVILMRLMLVLMFAPLLVSCVGKRITKANVDQVTEGMSKKQVESILVQPTSSQTEGPAIIRQTTYVYRQGKDTVTIIFRDD